MPWGNEGKVLNKRRKLNYCVEATLPYVLRCTERYAQASCWAAASLTNPWTIPLYEAPWPLPRLCHMARTTRIFRGWTGYFPREKSGEAPQSSRTCPASSNHRVKVHCYCLLQKIQLVNWSESGPSTNIENCLLQWHYGCSSKNYNNVRKGKLQWNSLHTKRTHVAQEEQILVEFIDGVFTVQIQI